MGRILIQTTKRFVYTVKMAAIVLDIEIEAERFSRPLKR